MLSLFSLAEGPRTPRARDFAYSAMSKKMKEKFVDLHNEYRGKVDPPAANMNYLVSHYLERKFFQFFFLGCSGNTSEDRVVSMTFPQVLPQKRNDPFRKGLCLICIC